VRKRDSYLAAQYRRLAKRRGDKKAIVAVGHSILVAAWHMLRDDVEYRDLGGHYFDGLQRESLVRYYQRRLAKLGVKAMLVETAVP
jgi:transposase